MQLPGDGFRIPMVDFRRFFLLSPELRHHLLEFVQQQASSMGQIAACNCLHAPEARLARWLLTAQDLTHEDVLDFTHAFLSEMLASKRTTLALVAGDLQRKGLIKYRRGHVTILHRDELEKTACDCYPILKRLRSNLYLRERNKVELQLHLV
jgi:CRP-like cAMP-binding protein